MTFPKVKYFCLIALLAPIASGIIMGQNNTIEYYYQQGIKNELTNVDSANYYFNLVDSIGYEKQDSAMIIQAAIYHSSYYHIVSKSDKSREYIYRALPYCRSAKDSLQLLNTLTANIDVYNSNTTDSLFLKVIALGEKVEKSDSTNFLSPIYNNYANLLHKKGELGKAALYYQQAAEIATNDYMKYQLYHSILNIFDALDNEPLIKEYLDKAINIAKKNNYKAINGNTALHKAKYLIRIGQVDAAKKEIEKAETYVSKLMPKNYELSKLIVLNRYYKSTNEWRAFDEYLNSKTDYYNKLKIQEHPTLLMAKAKCAYYAKNYSNSEYYAKQTLAKAEKMSLKNINITCHSLLAKIYSKRNRFAEAIKYKDINQNLSNKHFDNIQAQNIFYLEASFNRKEQQRAINDLNRSNQIKEENLNRKNNYLRIGALVISVISLLLLFLYRLYQKVKVQKTIISASLTEKDLLLREIHHRVKNNLQLVSSLLTMQGRSINDETTIQAINEGKSRVRSMALIHQDLYNRDNLTGISVKDYIEKLARELFDTYKISDNRIKLELNIDDMELDVDTVVPLGLIINELITNSFKYAWPNENEGVLNIDLKEYNGLTTLSVKDDGIGYVPQNVREESFGATLVAALTLQLEGKTNVKIDNGTETIITFKNNKP